MPKKLFKSYHQLTQDQRCQIYALKKRDFTQSQIAFDLQVSQSTISRELSRNTGKKGYRFKQAQDLASKRVSCRSRPNRVMTHELIAKAVDLLTSYQWSPVQISGVLKLENGIKISHESLYRHIWADKAQGGSLYIHLRQRGKKRNKRGSKNAGRGLIPNRVDIKERPKIVDEKTRIGDWELDSIIGAKHKGAITSIVDRKSKLTKLVLLKGPTAKATSEGIIKRLKPLAAHVHTLTSDNGKEFAKHAQITKKLEADFTFLHALS
jgi:transposase, IS30 family